MISAHYAGWPRAFSAVAPMRAVFEDRGVIEEELAAAPLGVIRGGEAEIVSGPEARGRSPPI